ncbi:hypothetical protein E2C00_19245 [Streptomyces sp. WAC05374]|nr:hypothetical protein EF905_08490 [Streptomyces sp. WAC05374]TDF52702.1 hypothetical protein E2C02_20715 [Streptomyces sp. WAC05374]TDF54121.1 hypothetical protein E2C00_19245 [Streptomyces sp. WAC05374]
MGGRARSFDRPNISLQVLRFQEDDDKRRAVVERAAGEPKTGIVYAATRKDTGRYAQEPAGLNLRAAAHHAGLRAGERSRVHDDFLEGALDVVVATSAFGMGIDKEDVWFVLHASIPGSLDAYYQEIGRAGGDGARAVAVLCYRPAGPRAVALPHGTRVRHREWGVGTVLHSVPMVDEHDLLSVLEHPVD